jgi:hypothetical protein
MIRKFGLLLFLPVVVCALSSRCGAESVMNFGDVKVGSSSPVQTFPYTVTNPLNASKTMPLAPYLNLKLNYGVDFTVKQSCDNKLSGGNIVQNCTVEVTFTPNYPGPHKDALFLVDDQGKRQTKMTRLLGGIGDGPLALINPDGKYTQPTQLSNYPQGGPYLHDLTIDDTNTIYVIDHSNNVLAITEKGISKTLLSNLKLGQNGPQGLALDGAGMLYITFGDYPNSVMTYDTSEYGPGNGKPNPLPIAPTGAPYCKNSMFQEVSELNFFGVATDQLGNTFVMDTACGMVVKRDSSGIISGTLINASGLASGTTPSFDGTLAVDGSDNLFFNAANINLPGSYGGIDSTIFHTVTGMDITTSNVLYTLPNLYQVWPHELAVDAADTVYMTSSAIEMLTPFSGTKNTNGTLLDNQGGTAKASGFGLAADGTVYMSDNNFNDSNNILAIKRNNITANIGSYGQQTSAPISFTVTVYNGGNGPVLKLGVPEVSNSNSKYQVFSLGNQGTCPFNGAGVLNPGDSCTVGLIATITMNLPADVPPYTGTLTLPTNSLNTAVGDEKSKLKVKLQVSVTPHP